MNNDNIVNVAMDKDYYAQVMSGGGSDGGNGGEYTFFNVQGYNYPEITLFSQFSKFTSNIVPDRIMIMSSGYVNFMSSQLDIQIKAIAIDKNFLINNNDDELVSLWEVLQSIPTADRRTVQELFNEFPQITEQEFYDLTLPTE